MKAGIGAVLVDLAGTIARFISASMKDEIVAAIKKSQRKTIIFELELFTILCAVVVWQQFIAGCAAVVYTDHDTVRDCLIACNTSSSNAKPILDLYLKLEHESSFNAWIYQVLTDPNIADPPLKAL